MPASVNSSSSSECGERPSRMWAALDARVDRLHARLRASGACRPASAAQRVAAPARAGLGDQAVGIGRVAQPAGDVGQEHHLVGAHRARDRAGGLVGVDVVGVALAVGADRGDHGDVVARDVLDHADVDALDAPDEADVLAAGRGAAGDPEQRAVVAAQARPPAGRGGSGAATISLLTLPTSTILATSTVLLVGHAQAADELDGQAEPLHVGRDLRAAAVDDDRVQPDVLEQHDVARELLAQRRVLHRGAAVLDDDGLEWNSRM